MAADPLRDYIYLGATRSLCPHCRRLVDAKIIARGGRVYFRKRCPEHGLVEDFISSDARQYDRHELDQPARSPRVHGTLPDKGCPYDCGLCEEHEQHVCVGLVEITSNCNLRCPMCFAESGPGGKHVDTPSCKRMIDRFVEIERSADILQLSGGEPTLHPDIVELLRYAYAKPIATIMLNTNGTRLAKDPNFLEAIAPLRDRLEIYLQFDGFEERTQLRLRGEPLLETKLAALEALRQAGIRSTLVCAVDHGTNLHELGGIVRFGLERPWIRGVSFQLATYCGRHLDPGELEKRVTMPDAVKAIVEQTGDLATEDDFLPLPCAHPECHRMCYLFRHGEGAARTVVPISKLIDLRANLDLVANSIVYTPERARALAQAYLARLGDCGPGCCGSGDAGGAVKANDPALESFLAKALDSTITGADVFRVFLTAFLDAHTFDVRRVMKCCIAHILPSGHAVPFCAYNTLYRDGHVALPPLAPTEAVRAEA